MRRFTFLALALALLALLAAPALSQQQSADTFALPNGWQPEGIAKGKGKTLYVGSIPTGRVLALNAKTGTTTEVVAQREGRAAIGLKHHRGRLFVAGGATGHAFVYDARTGEDVRDVALAEAPTFVNDVVVTRRAAWFTDSRRPQLYRLALGKRGAPRATARTVPITGDLKYDENPDNNEVNGIAATPNGRQLLVVQSNTGLLFRVAAATGEATAIPLTGGDQGLLPSADGILLQGRTLYVVQNRLNKIAVVRLTRRLSAGVIQREITHPAFDVPTTIARRGSFLYAPNARFGTPPSPDNEFAVVRVPVGA
jgi:sugar lactone lactonase YvrE